MARPLVRRLVMEGDLVAHGPLHVGGAGADVEADMPLAVNGMGHPYVPGTAIAGPIRAWMRRVLWTDASVHRWWGYQEEGDPGGGSASQFVVADATVTLPSGVGAETWHGIGIDREWGGTAREIKFERAVLPRGSRFSLYLHVDVPEESQNASIRAALWHLARALEGGEVPFGAASTRGLGCVRLERLRCREQDWSSRAGVLAVLGDEETRDVLDSWREASKTVTLRAPDRVRFEVEWEPTGPLMVKAPRDGLAVDALPLMTAIAEGHLTMVLPGSGIKGAWRAQAERIIRTLLRIDPPQVSGRERHRMQLDVPLVKDVFGSPRPSSMAGGRVAEKDAPRTKPVAAARAALSVHSCYARNVVVPRVQWANITSAPPRGRGAPGSDLPKLFADATLASRAAGGVEFQHAYHVAVDRWTSGAADGLLFSGVEPLSVQWDPIVAELDMDWAGVTKAQVPALVLVLLVIRDLTAGGLTLGFGGNRGYGSLRVREVRLWGRGPSWDWAGDGISLPVQNRELDLSRLGPAGDRMVRDWQAWIQLRRNGSVEA